MGLNDSQRPRGRLLETFRAFLQLLASRRVIVRSVASSGLLVSEMCTNGGVQAYMRRIAETLSNLKRDGQLTATYCCSLNDTTEELRDLCPTSSGIDVWGAGRSRFYFIWRCVFFSPRTTVVIVGHMGQAPVAYLMRMFGRTRKFHVVLHGIEAWRRASLVTRMALRGADSLISTTNYTAGVCGQINGIPHTKFQVVPLCTDDRSVSPNKIFQLRGDLKLLCVARQSRTERDKGLRELIRALSLVNERVRGVHLNLVGAGDDQNDLINEARRADLSDQVTFWGALDNSDLAGAYADCDVFVMPSKKEGFGIVFLEAMLYGKVCIGGNHGGTPEVIEDGVTGFLVDYGDIASLADRIIFLAERPDVRLRMGESGRQRLKQRFSASQFSGFYRGVFLDDP